MSVPLNGDPHTIDTPDTSPNSPLAHRLISSPTFSRLIADNEQREPVLVFTLRSQDTGGSGFAQTTDVLCLS